MKTLTNIVLFLVIAAFSGSCSSEDQKSLAKEASIDWPEILERDTLYAIVDNNSFSYFVYRGQPMGFEYEILSDFCKEKGLKLILRQSSSIDNAFQMLKEGQGDIIAYHLTITKERRTFLEFTSPILEVKQVLIQRKPENWRQMKLHNIEASLVRKPSELAEKTVLVRKGSAFVSRLLHLSEEIGAEINVVEDSLERSEEELMGMVAEGEIPYTVADNLVASLNQSYYPVLDTKTPLSLTQDLAWAVRKNSIGLLDTLNKWLAKSDQSGNLNFVRSKYFRNRSAARRRVQSEFASSSGGKISRYDSQIQEHANQLGWDWRLLTAVIYQESQFKADAKSWAGAEGLLQLMPNTGAEFGAKNLLDPYQNLEAGTKYLKWLDELFAPQVQDSLERQNFVLAAFNIGQGHILDAMRLAEKYEKDPSRWSGNVAEMLVLLEKPQYYKDSLVHAGYFKGRLALDYINKIQGHYQHYATLFNEDQDKIMALQDEDYDVGQ